MSLERSMAMRCRNCRHIYADYDDIYICPACGAGPPHTVTLYTFKDKNGTPIDPENIPRLRELGAIEGPHCREEALKGIFGVTQ
jgi:rubredoxin